MYQSIGGKREPHIAQPKTDVPDPCATRHVLGDADQDVLEPNQNRRVRGEQAVTLPVRKHYVPDRVGGHQW